MKAFLSSKPGMAAVLAAALMLVFAFHRVSQRRAERAQQQPSPAVGNSEGNPARATASGNAEPDEAQPAATREGPAPELVENVAYLEAYLDLDERAQAGRDRQGNELTRRENADSPDPVLVAESPEEKASERKQRGRSSLRLRGRATGSSRRKASGSEPQEQPIASAPVVGPASGKSPATPGPDAGAAPIQRLPDRFNPYGRVVKCELVFTIDSTLEETPLVGLVTAPVYNNGVLVIPAGAELHGVARPDRLRDRIFSGQQWVLVFPREGTLQNGRQLSVRGVALDRVEPDENGMTWGLTDGSFGLAGTVIRTMRNEEIKRFVATFLSGSSLGLQERRTDQEGRDTVRSTPRNAILQGLSANMQDLTERISAEIEKHGVFIRVPAGHQFYFYPMQVIDADAAAVVPGSPLIR